MVSRVSYDLFGSECFFYFRCFFIIAEANFFDFVDGDDRFWVSVRCIDIFVDVFSKKDLVFFFGKDVVFVVVSVDFSFYFSCLIIVVDYFVVGEIWYNYVD